MGFGRGGLNGPSLVKLIWVWVVFVLLMVGIVVVADGLWWLSCGVGWLFFC